MVAERIVVQDRAEFLLRREHRAVRVLVMIAMIGLWEALTRTGWIPALFLPSPLGVARELVEMGRSGQIFVHLAASLRRLLLGFSVGAGVGIVVGVIVGFFSLAEAIGRPLLAATFPIPKKQP